MDTRIFLVVLFIEFGGAFKVDLNPNIPTTTDEVFIKFQKIVADQQLTKKSPVFSNLDAYKTAFDSFRSKGNFQPVPGKDDTKFAKFQTFMEKYMRQYNNFDELKIRFKLFTNVLNNMGEYNYGGDGLSGVNNLSDKTLKEKQGFYG